MTQRPARPPSPRQLRVGEEIRHILADLLRRGDFHDPELHGLNVTVTEVRMSPDLRQATAFVLPFGGGDLKETVEKLRRATPYLRGIVARHVNLRVAPSLSFQPDTSFDYAQKIESLIVKARTEDESRRRDDDESEPD